MLTEATLCQVIPTQFLAATSLRRGMTEDLLKRTSEALNLNPIQIWDAAYRMFRYNYFLEWAAAEGVTVEELIDRVEVQPSIEKILESHQSKMEH